MHCTSNVESRLTVDRHMTSYKPAASWLCGAMIGKVCGHLPSTTCWLRASKNGWLYKNTGGMAMQTTRSVTMADREREAQTVHDYTTWHADHECKIAQVYDEPADGNWLKPHLQEGLMVVVTAVSRRAALLATFRPRVVTEPWMALRTHDSSDDEHGAMTPYYPHDCVHSCMILCSDQHDFKFAGYRTTLMLSVFFL